MADRSNFIGTEIGSYRIISEINSGAYGAVYQGKHVIFNDEPIVAIKLLHAHLNSKEAREQFIQEARILRKLKHLHILPILNAGIQDGIPYLVTEYTSGGSLNDRLKQQAGTPMPVDEALTIITQIGQALSYAHQQNVVHRDLKPGNILFNAQGEALLADFGIAVILATARTSDIGRGGTPAYMAPEQFEGKVSTKSDQYALGCIAYELLTGRRPFEVSNPTIEALWFQHAKVNPMAPTLLNPQLPPHIEQAILKAMAKVRTERHPDVAAFISALYTSQRTKEEWLKEGNAHYRAKRFEDALSAYEQVIRLDSKFNHAYYRIGKVLEQLKRPWEAIAAYDQAIHLNPKFANAYIGKGDIYKDFFKQHEKALEEYQKATHVAPKLALGYFKMGNALTELNRFEEALHAYESALRYDSNPIDTYYAMIDLLVNIQRYGDALALYDRVIQRSPKTIDIYYKKINLLERLQRYEEALTAYEQVIQLNPKVVQAHKGKGTLLIAFKRYTEAISSLDLAITLEPTEATVYYYRGNAYAEINYYERAIADYDNAIALNPEYADAYNNRGLAYYNLKQYQQAVTDYNHAIELDPNKVSAYYSRAVAYYELKEYQQSIANYDRALELDPQDAAAYNGRGNVYADLEEYERALADFDRAIALEENDASYIASRGQTYRLMGRYQEALADFDRAISLEQINASILADRGQTYRLMRRYQEALADFDRAISLDAGYARGFAGRGETCRLMARYHEALADFDQAIALDETYSWAIISRGQTFRLMARYHEALADFDHAIALDERDAWAFAQRGETYRLLGSYQEALADFDRALAMDEKETWTIVRRGKTYQQMGRYQEALADFDRAIVLDSSYAAAWYDKGNVHYDLQHYEIALESYEQALLLYRQTGDHLGEANVLQAMGDSQLFLQETGAALQSYEQALVLYRQIRDRRGEATICSAIGNVQKIKNELEEAIHYFEQALHIWREMEDRLGEGTTLSNLGTVYSDLQTGDRTDNLERAIACYQQALEIYDRDTMTPDYALTQQKKGLASWFLAEVRGGAERVKLLEQAIACYDLALEIYDRNSMAPDYATTQQNKGIALARLAEVRGGGEGVWLLEQAIACYDLALEIYDRNNMAPDYAAMQQNKGLALKRLAELRGGGEGVRLLEQAIACFDASLEIYNRNNMTPQYALTQQKKGLALQRLGEVREGAEGVRLLEQAIACYQEALRFLTPETAPLEYATTQNNLGITYHRLPTGDRAANLAQAISCYQEALRFWTSESSPLEYARTQNNLGIAYSDLPTGDRTANLEQAIACYQEALLIFGEVGDRTEEGATLHNLGSVYEAKGLKQEALSYYEQTLALYSQVGDQRDAVDVQEAIARLRSDTIEIFISYAHQDERFRDQLEKHLSFLRQQGIAFWHDRMIEAGREWTQEIDAHLNTAHIILLLVSADFLVSEYCYSIELSRALERHAAREALVIPIILRPVNLQGTPLENLQVLPKDGKPLTSWRNLDEALLDVTRDVQKAISELIVSRPAPLWKVPYQRNPFFTGREEVLQYLHSKLNEKIAEMSSLVVISGIAGIGKTQVALEYAYRYREAYQTVFWAKANEREALIADFTTIASLLDLPEKNAHDVNLCVNAIMRWLTANTSWLLILEDVEDLAMVRAFIPSMGEGHIILTTRLRPETMGLTDSSIILYGLHSDEGTLLLFRQARFISLDATLEDVSREDRVKAEEIYQALEGIPFLLAMAGAYIGETGVSLSDFLDLYRKRSGNLLGQQERLPLDYSASAAIIQSLVEEEQLVTYDVFLSIPSEPITIGGKLEVAIYLSVAGASSSGYSLAIHKDEAARGELNLFLNAQGFQVEGNNTACLPFPFSAAVETISNSVTTQVARFNLIALRPGPVEIAVELYRESAFETTLKAEVQVNSVQTGELPQPSTVTRPRSVLLPEFLLQVSRQWNETGSVCAFHYSFSSLRSSLLIADGVDFQSGLLSPQWIEQAQALLDNTLEDITGSLLEDAHTRLVSLGQYLFQHLIPSGLQEEIRRLAVFRQTFTLLIFADQDTWVPWELLHDGQAFLSERFIIGRWPHELNDTCPYEFPIGTIHIAHYANVRSILAEKWSSLLEVPGTPPPTILPGGLFDSLNSLEEMRGVHLMRFGSSSQSSELQDAPTRYVGADDTDSVERDLRIAKLNLRRNRPLVSLGYLSAGMPELTMLEQTWAPAFLRAGCSAFIGPLWAVQQTVAAAFTTGFYRRLWAGDSLGAAFCAGRNLAQAVAPESLDWLAYVLFGDPMARPYLPVKGQGYAVIEPIGREMDDPLPHGGTARFRVSLRRMPPVWHEQRVIEVAEDLSFEKLEINIVSSSLQVQPASPIEMIRTPTGDYMGWFTLTAPQVVTNKLFIVQIYFMDGVLPIHRLRFSLKVGKQGGDQL